MSLIKEKIDFIYEVVANKELSFWTKVYIKGRWEWILLSSDIWSIKIFKPNVWVWRVRCDGMKAIWKPIMLWDLLDRIEKSWIQGLIYDRPLGNHSITLYDTQVLRYRKEKTKPIEDQDDECIMFIYWIIVEWMKTSEATSN